MTAPDEAGVVDTRVRLGNGLVVGEVHPAGYVDASVYADALAAGLAALGAFLTANPDLARRVGHDGQMTTLVHSYYGKTARARIGEWVEAARRAPGVRLEEHAERGFAGVYLWFGAVRFNVYATWEHLGTPRNARKPRHAPLLGDDPEGGGS